VIRLSYVVVADEWSVVAELAAALDAQTAASEIELVVVAGRPIEPPPCRVTVRVVPASADTRATAREAGLRAAVGDIVALGETHVAPAPGWARAVLDAHDAGAGVVLPYVTNANPGSPLSCAAFLMDYGRYSTSTGPATPVPTYNASVRRDVLLALPDPGAALEPGLRLDADVRAQGVRVVQAPGAELAHLNVDRTLDWARERVLGGVLLGRSRRQALGPARRVAYAAAFPLIACLLAARALRIPRREWPRGSVAAVVLGCGLYAAGEAIGYIGPLGDGRAESRMGRYEMYKRDYAGRK
jgi:hypothetical protein